MSGNQLFDRDLSQMRVNPKRSNMGPQVNDTVQADARPWRIDRKTLGSSIRCATNRIKPHAAVAQQLGRHVVQQRREPYLLASGPSACAALEAAPLFRSFIGTAQASGFSAAANFTVSQSRLRVTAITDACIRRWAASARCNGSEAGPRQAGIRTPRCPRIGSVVPN